MKRCSASYVIRELQIKTMRYHCTPIRMAKIQNTDTTKCWQRCETTGTLIHCWWECKTCKMVQPLRNTVQWLLNITLTVPSSNHTPRYLPKVLKTQVHTKNLHMDDAALFKIAKTWKQPRSTSVGEQINCGTSYNAIL